MLKLAEAKNGALISFNGLTIFFLVRVLMDIKSNGFIFYYLCFAITVCFISIFLSLTSLVAQLKDSGDNLELSKNENLMFFGTIAHLSPERLLEGLKSRYNFHSTNENYEWDLAQQAIITAQIAKRKHRTFNIAIAWTFLGIATPFSVLIYKLFFDPNRK